MKNIIEKHKKEFEKAVEFGKKDMSSIRSNRASSKLVNNILVESYGTKTPLEELASISVADAHTIVVSPWDKNIVKEIEKALSQADIGANPNIGEDNVIRLNLPPLNQETREKIVKVLNKKLENARESLRSIRDEVKSKIEKAEKNHDITEDDKYRLIEKLDELTHQKQAELEEFAKNKKQEIKG